MPIAVPLCCTCASAAASASAAARVGGRLGDRCYQRCGIVVKHHVCSGTLKREGTFSSAAIDVAFSAFHRSPDLSMTPSPAAATSEHSASFLLECARGLRACDHSLA